MQAAGIDFIPANDFSLYDHMLDAAVALGSVRPGIQLPPAGLDLDDYFAFARGGVIGGQPVAPLDLTKWFDTNYHHLVPELDRASGFRADPTKPLREMHEARGLGIDPTIAFIGPLTFLLRSRAVDGCDRLQLLDRLVDAYCEMLGRLAEEGASWVRLDEPVLVEDRDARELEMLEHAYRRLAECPRRPQLSVSTYFGHVGDAMATLVDLPVEGIGLDLCRGVENLALLEASGGARAKVLFAGVVDGRNVWVNDLARSLDLLDRCSKLATEVVVSTSCSLIHVPLSVVAETSIDPAVATRLAFAEEKLVELAVLARGAGMGRDAIADALADNRARLAAQGRRSPRRPPRGSVAARGDQPASSTAREQSDRRSPGLAERAEAQRRRFALPLLPTTTIGSFPQTAELRAARAAWRAGGSDDEHYRALLRAEIDRVVEIQEGVGLDVLVHGEPERDDMVRYFAANLTGFALTENGWVQSYGSRCVRPPILFGDVDRHGPITLEWARYAQSATARPMKAILTGPVTMVRWSFVRDDQPEETTALQVARAIRDELVDLQEAGIGIIQVDEPAFREGLPLRQAERASYLEWATSAFRTVSAAAKADTQVHTHMCYARFGDVLSALSELDVDVISLEAARSGMSLLDELGAASYAGGVGPGVYDVHSPEVPSVAEIEELLERALHIVGPDRLWVNPDCGLKTRRYEEAVPALGNMVEAAKRLRERLNR